MEFSEIDRENLPGNWEESSLNVSLHSPGNGTAPFEDLKENIENGDEAFVDNLLSRGEEFSDIRDFGEIENEESKTKIALDEADKGISNEKIDTVPKFEDEQDNLYERKHVDNYNILTVVDNLKGRFRDAQELSIPENNEDENCKEDKNEGNSPRIGFVKLDAVSEISKEEEEEYTIRVPHLQSVIGEETDVNNNEVIDKASVTGKIAFIGCAKALLC